MSQKITMADAVQEATRLAAVLRVAGSKDFDLELKGKDAIEFEVMRAVGINQEEYEKILVEGLWGCFREWHNHDDYNFRGTTVKETFDKILEVLDPDRLP